MQMNCQERALHLNIFSFAVIYYLNRHIKMVLRIPDFMLSSLFSSIMSKIEGDFRIIRPTPMNAATNLYRLDLTIS